MPGLGVMFGDVGKATDVGVIMRQGLWVLVRQMRRVGDLAAHLEQRVAEDDVQHNGVCVRRVSLQAGLLDIGECDVPPL